MKVLPESAEYFMLAIQCDKLLQSNDYKTIESWSKEVVKTISDRYQELEKELQSQVTPGKSKKPRPPKDEFLRELVLSMGGVYKGNYHYEIPDGLPTPLHLRETGKLLMRHAYEIQTFPRFLWGTGLVLSMIFTAFAVFVALITPSDIYSWIMVALLFLPLGYCYLKLRDIAPFNEALRIMRERIAKTRR
jgi:hypothetical protein